jgi:hypothetical protein
VLWNGALHRVREAFGINRPGDFGWGIDLGLTTDQSWHVDTQLITPEMQESELLFPSIAGTYRAPTVLNKPFA